MQERQAGFDDQYQVYHPFDAGPCGGDGFQVDWGQFRRG